MVTICKTVLNGATPGQIQGLMPAQLRDLAVQLTADPDLTVSLITYDGRVELKVLHAGPPYRTVDRGRFTGQVPLEMSIASPAGLQDAVTLVRAILADPAAP